MLNFVPEIPHIGPQFNSNHYNIVRIELENTYNNTNNALNTVSVNNSQINRCSGARSLSMLNVYKNNFNFVHINVQGLLESNHIDQPKAYLYDCDHAQSAKHGCVMPTQINPWK